MPVSQAARRRAVWFEVEGNGPRVALPGEQMPTGAGEFGEISSTGQRGVSYVTRGLKSAANEVDVVFRRKLERAGALVSRCAQELATARTAGRAKADLAEVEEDLGEAREILVELLEEIAR